MLVPWTASLLLQDREAWGLAPALRTNASGCKSRGGASSNSKIHWSGCYSGLLFCFRMQFSCSPGWPCKCARDGAQGFMHQRQASTNLVTASALMSVFKLSSYKCRHIESQTEDVKLASKEKRHRRVLKQN